MKNRWIKGFALLCGSVLFLTGCADAMPDMTSEQRSLVAEYAADVLLRHSSNYDSGLDTQSQMEEPVIPEIIPEEQQEETEQVKESLDDMEATQDSEALEEVDEEENNTSINDILQLDGMQIEYVDYEIVDSYPKEEDAIFNVSVSEGKKILAIYFNISNISDEDMECDIFSINPQISVNLNGQGNKNVMSTLLLDDISTYKGTIKAGDQTRVVTLLEVKDMEDSEVESLSLQINAGGQSGEIKLF